jgi:hypothetical protein
MTSAQNSPLRPIHEHKQYGFQVLLLTNCDVSAAAAAAAAYAMGFFQGLSSVAYGSDQILDLIPCDTVAALVIAAAAAAAADTQLSLATSKAGSSSSSSGTTTIYHASSSASHPMPIADGFSYMADYWTANPPPLRLPLTK